MKMIRVIKSAKRKSALGISDEGIERLKQVSTEVEVKDNVAILKSNMTGNFMLFDYNKKEFVDDETYSDIESARQALENYTK